ncbi:MAG: serine/threonine-protein kinase [Polyangiaceae bacterium]
MANPDENPRRTALGVSGGRADAPSVDPLATTNPSEALIGVVIGGRYRIERLLGEGGMGAVYQAEHTLMRKRLAVKVLHAEMSRMSEVVARFEREAMAAAHIEHPNVAAASDFGKLDDGSFFLVLEFVEGTSLRDAIGRGPFGVPRALHVARQISAALQRAHGMGIVHRDLKPENVMLVAKDGDGDFVKVLDFGIAKVPVGEIAGELRNDKPGQVLTRQGMLYGTPEYMAPEQALGQDVDPRADLYALGVMMFEMITGKRPFDHESKVTLLGMHVTAPIPTFAERAPDLDVPPGVEAMVRKLLAKEANDRFADARELSETLAQFADPNGVDELGRPRISSTPGTGSRPSFTGGAQTQKAIGTPAAMAGSPGTLPIVATQALGAGGMGILAFPREKKSQRTWMIATGATVLALVVIVLLVKALSSSDAKRDLSNGTASTNGTPSPSGTKDDKDPGEDDLEIITPQPGTPQAEAFARDIKAVEDLMDSGQVSAALDKLRTLRKRRPRDVQIRRLLVRGLNETKQSREAMSEAFSLVEQSAEAAGDPMIIGAVRDAALENEGLAFDILEKKMGPNGLDILYDLAFPKGGSRSPQVSKRAAEVLAKPAVREKATPALAVALKLRSAGGKCEAIKELLGAAAEHGDGRSQSVLVPLTKTSGCGFANARDCWPCLRKDARLDTALKSIAARAPKSP